MKSFLSNIMLLIRIKLSYGVLFDCFVFLSAWRYKQQLAANQIINPTFNLRLVSNVEDSEGRLGMRGTLVNPELPVSAHERFLQREIFNVLFEISRSKGNQKREAAMLAVAPPLVKQMLTNLNIVIDRDGAPSRIKYINYLEHPHSELLVPRLEINQSPRPAKDSYRLIANHLYRVQTTENIPPPVLAMMGDQNEGGSVDVNRIFALVPPILWCLDDIRGFVSPYKLTQEQHHTISSLIDGSVSIVNLEDDLFDLLVEVGFIINESEQDANQKQFNQLLSEASHHLKENNYVVIRGLFNAIHASWQRDYYKRLVAGGYFRPHCDQVPNRESWHNEAYACYVHQYVARIINRVLPEPVKPSYCYLGHYYNEADLKRHVDRDQCQWNISMPLDYFPNVDPSNSWPLYLQLDQQDESTVRSVALGVGDIVIYSGTKILHWREKLGRGKTVTQCFFHFVNQHFDGSLD
jgi:hypothetical protein